MEQRELMMRYIAIIIMCYKIIAITLTHLYLSQINELAVWLATEMNKITYDCLYEPGPVFEKYKELREKYSIPDKPFLFQVRTKSKMHMV